MKTTPSRKPDRILPCRGSALISVVIILMLLTALALSTYGLALQEAHIVRIQTHRTHARAIAEAGVNETFIALQNAFYSTPRGQNVEVPFADGTYQVTIEEDSTNPQRLRITSVGTYQGTETVVGMDLRDDNEQMDTPGGFLALNFAIFANGNLRFNGAPQAIVGDLHTNWDWELNGGNYNGVQGKISARTSKHPIPDQYKAVWQEITFPLLTDPDFQDFIESAKAGGVPYTEHNGNQRFGGNHTFNGITVINGNLTFNGAGTRTVNGMLYVTGNVTQNGASVWNVEGMILAGGNIRLNGSAGIFSYAQLGGDMGGVGACPDANAQVAVSAWWHGVPPDDAGFGGGS